MKGYIKAFLVGLLILPFTIHSAHVQRGYEAVGGEFLVPILFVIGYGLYVEFKPKKRKKPLCRATR